MNQVAVLEYKAGHFLGRGERGSPMSGNTLPWSNWHSPKDYFIVDRSEPATLAEKLSRALAQSKKAVRSRAHLLGGEQMHRIIERLTSILDPEDWDEEDSTPSFSSADALMRATVAVAAPVSSLSISRSGNLRGMWAVPQGFLTIEGLADGSVSWIFVREHPNEVERIEGAGSVAELQDQVNI